MEWAVFLNKIKILKLNSHTALRMVNECAMHNPLHVAACRNNGNLLSHEIGLIF